MPRYTCLLDPCDTWTVWDEVKELPAVLAGKELIGMPLRRAVMAREALERIGAAEDDPEGRR